jgi:transcriptional regulator with XRE-family HTH domain
VINQAAMYTKNRAAERLVQAQRALGLSNADLAKRAQVSAHAWSQYRTADRTIPHKALAMLKEQFGVTTDWILVGDASGLPHGLYAKILAAAA